MVRTDTPGVYRRGERFVTVWRHRGLQHKQTFGSYDEAIAARRRRQSGDTRPDRSPTAGDSLAHFARVWIEHYPGRTQHGIDEETRSDYRRSLEVHVIPELGRIPLRAVTPWDIRQLVRTLETNGLRPSSVRKHIAPVKALFAMAYEDALIDRDPAAPIRIGDRRAGIRIGPPERKALTREELRRLLAAVEPESRLVVEFAVHTGLRCGEIAGLHWEHVTFGELSTVTVRQQYRNGYLKPPKSPSSMRTLPLSPGMAASLAARRRSVGGAPGDPIFASRAGRRLDAHNFATRVLRPAAQATGLGPLGFHRLRHTCAALLFEAGKDLKQVQEWLGHADPRTTMRTYLHLLDRGLGTVEFMDAFTASPLFPGEPLTPTGALHGHQET